MRILQVMAGGKHDGAKAAFVGICTALFDAGEDVEVVTRGNDSSVSLLEDAGLTVHKLPFGGVPDIYTSWQMRRILKVFEPDIVQSWMSRASSKVPKWVKSITARPYIHVGWFGSSYKVKHFTSCDALVVQMDDDDALKRAVHALEDDRVLQARFWARGDDAYLSELKGEKSVQRCLEFYHSLIDRDLHGAS